MAVKTAAELKAYFETGDRPTEQQFVDLIDTIFGLALGTKIYLATVTSPGVGALNVNVIKNTLGYDLTSNSGLGVGSYFLNAPPSSFDTSNAIALIQNQFTDGTSVSIDVQTDFISLASTGSSSIPVDGIFNNTTILIIVQ